MKPTRKSGPIGKYLSHYINECGKTQAEIASELGYEHPNIITMFKQERTRVPLKTAGPLAKAIGADPVELLQLLLVEYAPETLAALMEVFDGLTLTPNERRLIQDYRAATEGRSVRLIEIRPAVVVSFTDPADE